MPTELETGLDPPQIPKLLGGSLRQCFHQTGLPDTARALGQSCAEVNSVQKQLVNVLREVAHPDIGVIGKVRSANDAPLRRMTTRAQQMDDFLVKAGKAGLGDLAACRCRCRSSTGIRVGYVVCQRTATGTGDTRNRGITTKYWWPNYSLRRQFGSGVQNTIETRLGQPGTRPSLGEMSGTDPSIGHLYRLRTSANLLVPVCRAVKINELWYFMIRA